MSSLDKLPNSFHAAGTNEGLDLSLPWCASCCPTNCQYSTWSGSLITRFAKKCVAPNRRSSAGWIPDRQVLRWRGTQASSGNAQSIIENAVNEESRRTTTPNWCAVFSDRAGQGNNRDAQCLGTCNPSRSRKLPQQRNSGGEFLAQSLEVVTESKRTIQLYPKIRWDWTGWQ